MHGHGRAGIRSPLPRRLAHTARPQRQGQCRLRYAEIAADLSAELEAIVYGKIPDDLALADMWTAHNASHSFVMIRNPAMWLTV